MNDAELLRYSRQIMLPEIDIAGQKTLLDARVMIIGLGGLGSAVSMYLAATGVGDLILVDFDRVDLSNLQRQVIHATDDISRLKVDSACDRLLALNPGIRVTPMVCKLDDSNLEEEMRSSHVIVDASDNFATRFAINRACVKYQVPLISAAAIRFEGQFGVFDPRDPASPCYQCLYGERSELSETCSETGVIGPLLGMMGSLQASETIKLLLGIGTPMIGELLLVDILNNEWHKTKLPKDPACPVCSHTGEKHEKDVVDGE